MDSGKDNATYTPPQPTMTEQELEDKAKIVQRSFIGYLFPVVKGEWSRVCPMILIFSICAFSYTFLRMFKDVVIHSVLEPAAQNWLKILTFPASLIIITFINSMVTKKGISKAFGFFTVFFAVFVGLIGLLIMFRTSFQYHNGWAESKFVGSKLSVFGLGICYVPALISNHWILSLFYIICETIGSVMISYLPLVYFNTYCTSNQNKRFIPILYIFSNLSAFGAAFLYNKWNGWAKNQSYIVRERFFLIFSLMITALFFTVFAVKTYYLDAVFAKPIVTAAVSTGPKKTKLKVSMLDGICYAFTSRLLLSICAMTLFYNMSQVLVSSHNSNGISGAAKLLHEDKASLANEYKSRELMLSTLFVTITMFTPLSKLYEWFGLGSSGSVPIFATFFGTLASCWVGAINYPALGESNMWPVTFLNDAKRHPRLECNVNLAVTMAFKISKYAFFDIIKEIISMKIDPEVRPLYKAVFDGVCGRLGKSLGALYGIIMEIMTGCRDSRGYLPISFLLICIFVSLWSIAMTYIHRKNEETNKKQEAYFKEGNTITRKVTE